MDKQLYDHFIDLLEIEDKDGALNYVLTLLETEKISIEVLYEELLAPSLLQFSCKLEDQEICIWREHTRTSIIRTILEATYPFIVKRKKTVPVLRKKVIVVCPQEEYHEIGAIMATNYFSLAGFEAQYIGANTPKEQIISAVKALKPDYLALSVTNYYNLFTTKKTIDEIREQYPHVKIIVGGQAFMYHNALDQLTYDHHIIKVQDIFLLAEEAQK
ncbi:MAG: cobalamin B12-binding domain-containing protein [Candidatus Izemoplasmatales bacterium]|jgi:methanogenic corrinoid protein MtbC1